MHSPNRSVMSVGNSHTLTSLQTPQILSNLSKALSTSANALSAVEITPRNHLQPQSQLQPSSPPYYHNTSKQSVPSFENTNVPIVVASAKLQSDEIQVESPKNVTIVQPAKFQPYKEVTKPFEMSDFYKYSTKFRQKTASANIMQSETHSPQLPPKNVMHQTKNPHRHVHPIAMNANSAEPTTAYSVNH